MVSDTPSQVVLPPNAILIDGNLASGGGVDLGLPSPGGDARPRNLGLDFFNATEVNTLFVWVDRELPLDIANSFSWEIYTSEDNRNWTLRQTVSAGSLRAVLQPVRNQLSERDLPVHQGGDEASLASVVGATAFPSIQVTELQALIRRPAQAVNGKISQTSHVLNLNARATILRVPSLYYDFSYFLTKTPPSPSHISLSNGLSMHHQFGRTVNATARVGQRRLQGGEGE